jgi:beta-lactam-binding protein with PASTA domain
MTSHRPEAKNSVRIQDSGATWAERRAGKWSLLLAVVLAGLCANGCKKPVAVPNVAQQDLEQAKQTLTAAHLKPGNISGSQGAGAYVVTQSPGPNEQVKPDSPVDLTVELPVALPDMVKQNVTDAVSTLQSMGLKVMFVKDPARKLFGGPKVTAQSPAAATLVHRDALVTLTVQAPPDLTALVGLVTKEPAYEKLKPEYRNVLDAFLK